MRLRRSSPARALSTASIVAFAVVSTLILGAGSAVASTPQASSLGTAAATPSMDALAEPAALGAADTAIGDRIATANLADFRPGNIISDGVFFNSSTMDQAQVQAFLNSRVPSCSAGYTCLKDYRESSNNRAADAMCGAYSGAANELASTIIVRVAQACGINPQVLIVTLQKEQSLVTHTSPSAQRYRAAMGQGCPDTAACDSRYYGFFNQVYGAAWQFKRYANPPGTSNTFTWYAPGRTWNILFHPNRDCGTTPVYVENQATANLYYYTPYQPNAAARSAGYGLGDGCSSYGNRNFYNYFTDWFGSTQGETMQILQVAGTSQRYIVSGGSRWRLATAEIAAQYTWITTVRDVSQADIDRYTDKGAADRAIRTESGIVWLLDSGQRLRLNDVAQVTDFGWDYGSLPVASDAQANRYRDGGWLARVVTSGGLSWLVQSGSRRQVVDLGVLPRYGIPAQSTQISSTMVAEYPVTAPVVGVGIYRDATNPYRLQTDGGVYVVPDAASGTSLARSSRELTAESFAFLRTSTYMPVRITSGGRSYVMLEDSWLEVSASDYPASLPFAALPNGAAAGIPSAGRVSGPHFIRERSDAQVYLVSWGTVQAVSSADQAWVTRTYGVSPRVWVGLDGTIGDAANTEGLVRTASGAAYLLDGTRAYRMRDCAQVSAWGANCASLPTVTDAKIAGFVNAGVLRDLVRTPAGTTWLPQSGQMRQVLDPGILAVYGISSTPSAVSAASVAKLPVGEPVLAAGVYSDGANARVAATEGGEFTLTADQSVGVVRSSTRALTAASFAKITVDGAMPSRLRSDGRSFILTQEGWLEVSAAAYGGDAMFTALPSKAWRGIVLAANEQRPHFVRDDVAPQEYLVSGGYVQPVSGASERGLITSTYGVPSKVWPLVGGALAGVRVNYDLMAKGASGEVYLIDGSTRYRMSGCTAVTDFGKNCATLKTLTAAQLAATQDGGSLAALLRSPDGYIYLPQSGTKREVPDPRVLSVYGIGTASTSVSAQVLAQLRLGQPVVSVGVYDDRAGDVRVVTGNGRTFTIPAASRIGSVTSSAWTISPASIDLMTAEGNLPTRVNTTTQTYVLTAEGWLAVSSSAYAPLAFASIGTRAVEGIPSAGSEARPHFVREQTSTQVYLASGGLGTVGDEAARAWISSTYGVPAKVWVVPDGTLR